MKQGQAFTLLLIVSIFCAGFIGYATHFFRVSRANESGSRPTVQQGTMEREEFEGLAAVPSPIPTQSASTVFQAYSFQQQPDSQQIANQSTFQIPYVPEPEGGGAEAPTSQPNLPPGSSASVTGAKNMASQCGREVIGDVPPINIPCECIMADGRLEYKAVCGEKTYSDTYLTDASGQVTGRMTTWWHTEWQDNCKYQHPNDFYQNINSSCTFQCIDRTTFPPPPQASF